LSETESTVVASAVVHPFQRDEVHFGFGIAAGVNAHLQRAATLVSHREDSLQALNDAYQAAPDQLEVLVALFKFHFYQGDTEKAERLVFEALDKASRQGGFNAEWQRLTPESADWSDPRGAGRFYLYSLKALAFIRLRQDELAKAADILETMASLDPDDLVGANVIRDLLEGMSEGQIDG
jgi:tetratricopeptide (TPR) repeat protein